jgi:hypothetical protein
MSAPAPANAPASTGFLSGLFGAKKTNAPKPANAAAPAVVGGRRRSRKDRKNRNRSRKDRSRSRKNRNRSRKNRNRE